LILSSKVTSTATIFLHTPHKKLLLNWIFWFWCHENIYFLRRRLSNKRIIAVDMKKCFWCRDANALNAMTNVAVDLLIDEKCCADLKCSIMKIIFEKNFETIGTLEIFFRNFYWFFIKFLYFSTQLNKNLQSRISKFPRISQHKASSYFINFSIAPK